MSRSRSTAPSELHHRLVVAASPERPRQGKVGRELLPRSGPPLWEDWIGCSWLPLRLRLSPAVSVLAVRDQRSGLRPGCSNGVACGVSCLPRKTGCTRLGIRQNHRHGLSPFCTHTVLLLVK